VALAAVVKKRINPAHLLFEKHLSELAVCFAREFRFHDMRRWRFDYLLTDMLAGIGLRAWRKASKIAVEIEGAIWNQCRHTRGKGYQADLDKYNAATMMGYRVLRFSTEDVMLGRAKAFLAAHLKG